MKCKKTPAILLIFAMLLSLLPSAVWAAALPADPVIGEQVAAPTADPSGGVYTVGTIISVSLETTTSGAEIYYTLDGKEPDSGSQKYTDAIRIIRTDAGNTVLKAVAIKGTEASSVSTFTYTFVPISLGIEDTLKAADGETVTTSGVVTSVDGTNLTLQDSTGGIYLIFSTAPGLTRGQEITVFGQRATYRESLPSISGATLMYNPFAGALPSPETVDFTALTDASLNRLVAPTNSLFTMGEEGHDGFTNITQNGETLPAKLQGPAKDTLEPDDELNITSAVLISDQGAYALIVPDGCYERVTPAIEPVIATPGSGTIFAGEAVTLSSKTPGCAIYYKVNGGITMTAGNPLTITVSKDSVIETFAIKEGIQSTQRTYTYSVQWPFTLAKGPVVIWEVYGGGGGSDAAYKNDYIVLKNISDADVNISGWSLQSAAANSAAFEDIFTLPQGAVVEAGKYYLIQAAGGSGGTLELPTPDAVSSLALDGTSGQIALAAYSSAGITGLDDPNLADFVGYGTSVWYLGAAGAAALDAAHSARRATTGFGGEYEPDNSADYKKAVADLDYLGRSPLSIRAIPAPGAVAAGTEVKLSTSIDDAVIYYTTNGTEPTAQSAQYDPRTDPLLVNTALTIKAYLASPTLGNSTIHTFSYTLSDHGGSGGSGSGSGGGTGAAVTAVPAAPTPDNPNPPTEGVVKPNASVNKDGEVKVTVSGKDIQSALDKAAAQAKKDGKAENGVAVAIDLTGLKTSFHTLPLTLSKSAYAKLLDAGVQYLSIQTPQLSLSLDLETLKAIHAAAGGDVTIRAELADQETLPGGLQGRPAYGLTITSGKETVSAFGEGLVTVTLPYALREGEQGAALQMAWLDAAGEVQYVADSGYDGSAKAVTGRTGHFTVFGVAEKPAPDFIDISGHWAEDDILFAASRGLLEGTGDRQFSPDGTATRAQLAAILWRMEGSPAPGADSAFTDTVPGAWYAAAVAWCAEHGLMDGYGSGLFGPEDPITREQLAALLYRYTQFKGLDVSVGEDTNILSYTDAFDVSEWAIPALQWACGAGVIDGKDGGRLAPLDTATRAEVSTVLHRFVENIISRNAS